MKSFKSSEQLVKKLMPEIKKTSKQIIEKADMEIIEYLTRKKITIWGEDLFQDQTVLLLTLPTGIIYNFQCGGVSCEQIYKEGLALPAFDLLNEFDECSYGCSYIGFDKDIQSKMANDLNNQLIKETEKFTFKLLFDFDNISELKGGCIPIIFNGKYFDNDFGELKGYLFTGNCD